MTYFNVLLTFIVPPLIALAAWVARDFWRWLFNRKSRQELRHNWLPYKAILLHALIALVYTTPWDNYLVATGVWWYNPELVTGITLGWVPIEEYTFFIVQTLLTGLWTVWMLRKIPATRPGSTRLNLWGSVIAVLLWVGSLVLWLSGWQPGTYLALILIWAMLPLLLQIAFGADILFSRKRALLLAIGIPTLYLWAVDAVAIAAGTWIIDPQQTTGLKLGPLPVEEMLFFAVTNIIVAGGITLICAPEGQQRAKKLFTRWSGANRKPFPGPTSFELLRSLPAIQANPMQYLEQVTRHYGDVVGIQAGPIRAVVVNDREAIKHILQDNHRNYTKDTIQYNSLAAITGRGLLTSDGDFWFRQRRQLQPAFIRRNLVNYAPAIDTAIAHMLERWQPYADNDLVLDVDAEMMVTTLEIVGQALFSVDLSQKAPALTKAVITCLDHIMYRARHITALPNSFPTARNLRFKKALAILDEEVANIINQRRASTPRQDMLGALIKNLDESGEKGMTPAQLRDEIITILIAGHETVASALTWSCYLLSQNPAILKKMRSELDRVLGGRLPGMSDLPDLTYTRMVFEETLRLYPPAWLITRRASEDDEIAAGVIPAGALVIIGVSAVHHHPAYWPDPDTFDPERFAPEHSADNPRYAYLPFGGGRRLCIGNNFALAEAPLILASIYQRYRLDVLPGHKIEPEPLVTIRPRNGLPMTLHNA